MFREAVWAVSQHYDVWPTPLIDVTTNLRIAASFALWAGRAEGQLYMVALTPSTNSVTFDADQHIVLARLQAVCTPSQDDLITRMVTSRADFRSPDRIAIRSIVIQRRFQDCRGG
jgi:FRG domain